MKTTDFEAGLRADGYLDIETKRMQADCNNAEHSHPFDVRALVLDGSATIGCAGDPVTYRAGDLLELAAGTEHTEQYGPGGYRALVGRRHPGAA